MLIARAGKPPITWDRCLFVQKIGTFWYLVSKKLHNVSEIIHPWRLWRWKTVHIHKKHWKLMIFKSQFHHMCTLLCLVFPYEYTYLSQKCCGYSLLTYELKFKISQRSQLKLWRYLQTLPTLKSAIFNVFCMLQQFCTSKDFEDG